MYKRIIYTALILLVAGLGFRLLSISNSDFTAISIASSNSHQTNHINIGDLPADNLSNQFPHQEFLTLIDNQGHESIEYLISKLNEKGITAFEAQSITSRLLTSDLKGELLNSNLDSLYALLQFTSFFKEEFGCTNALNIESGRSVMAIPNLSNPSDKSNSVMCRYLIFDNR